MKEKRPRKHESKGFKELNNDYFCIDIRWGHFKIRRFNLSIPSTKRKNFLSYRQSRHLWSCCSCMYVNHKSSALDIDGFHKKMHNWTRICNWMNEKIKTIGTSKLISRNLNYLLLPLCMYLYLIGTMVFRNLRLDHSVPKSKKICEVKSRHIKVCYFLDFGTLWGSHWDKASLNLRLAKR